MDPFFLYGHGGGVALCVVGPAGVARITSRVERRDRPAPLGGTCRCHAPHVRVPVGADYVVTDDPGAIDRDRLFGWLVSSYWWSEGLHRSVFDAALEHSLCFSVLTNEGDFVGFGRMVTDRATFAYWADVFVDPAHRGRGLGQALTSAAIDHPALVTCRRILLATRDAHDVYARHGFGPLAAPSTFMEITRPDAGARRPETP